MILAPAGARRSAVTRNVFSITFGASPGSRVDTTPTRYYLEMRLNRARQLLRQTSMPILSVGLACGFVSASHFSKCYSEHFDRTPSEERKGMRVERNVATAIA